MTHARRAGAAMLAAVVLVAPLALGGTTAAATGQGAAAERTASSTLTVASPVGSVPTSVFPFYTANQCTTVNIDYWNLMTRPGYWFGLGRSVAYQPALSVLTTPTYTTTGANTTVSFSVKGWTWSDGAGGTEVMTAQDVAFFLNMDRAQSRQGGNSFCGDTPGIGLPDQVVSVSYPGGLSGTQVTIVFAGHPNHEWLLYNELSQIVPLATAWDTTGSGFAGCSTEPFSAVGVNGGNACNSVFTYLSGLQSDASLWNWADGPYRQLSFPYHGGSPSGGDVQVANTQYSGPVKPQAVKEILYTPYAIIAPEISALQSNQLDMGFVDTTDVSKSPGPGRAGHNLLKHMGGYDVQATSLYGVFYWMFNFDNARSSNPTTGPMPVWAKLNNLQYFRAALQESINQPYVISQVDNGYATPTSSAIPPYPKDGFNSGVVNPYPYVATKGRMLMKAHGWNTNVFPDVCATTNCGSALFPIPRGARASVQVLLPLGIPSLRTQAMDEAASIKKSSGIQLRVKISVDDTVDPLPCPGHWEICGYGGWVYAPDYYPSGEVLFAPGSSSNLGGYDSPEMNALIAETTTNGDLALNAKDLTYHTSFAQWSATDVPFLWQPTPTQFIEVAKSMQGEQAPNPLDDFNPEYITQI
jgi:peptide/nickel transport system substrate-binding protein